MLMRKPVLVLNGSFHDRRASFGQEGFHPAHKGKAVTIVSTNREVYPGVFLPSVIRLVDYHFVPVRMQQIVSEKHFTRDGFKCMYCGGKGGDKGLEAGM